MKAFTFALVGAVLSVVSLAKPLPTSDMTLWDRGAPSAQEDAACDESGATCDPKQPKNCCSCQCLYALFIGYICGGGNDCHWQEALAVDPTTTAAPEAISLISKEVDVAEPSTIPTTTLISATTIFISWSPTTTITIDPLTSPFTSPYTSRFPAYSPPLFSTNSTLDPFHSHSSSYEWTWPTTSPALTVREDVEAHEDESTTVTTTVVGADRVSITYTAEAPLRTNGETCDPPFAVCDPNQPKNCCSCQCLYAWTVGYVCGGGNDCDKQEAVTDDHHIITHPAPAVASTPGVSKSLPAVSIPFASAAPQCFQNAAECHEDKECCSGSCGPTDSAGHRFCIGRNRVPSSGPPAQSTVSSTPTVIESSSFTLSIFPLPETPVPDDECLPVDSKCFANIQCCTGHCGYDGTESLGRCTTNVSASPFPTGETVTLRPPQLARSTEDENEAERGCIATFERCDDDMDCCTSHCDDVKWSEHKACTWSTHG